MLAIARKFSVGVFIIYENIKSIKFPLFYPTLDEVKDIIENQTSLNIDMCKSETKELVEVTREEIIGFIKGFSHNFLLGVLGEEKLSEFYIALASKIDNDIDRIRSHQWRHCILTLSK